jgi:hypothetical protein
MAKYQREPQRENEQLQKAHATYGLVCTCQDLQ